MLILSKTNSQLGASFWWYSAANRRRPVSERYVMRCPQHIGNLLYIRKLENKHAPGVARRNCIIPHCPSNLGAIVYSDYRRHGISAHENTCARFSLSSFIFCPFYSAPVALCERGHQRAPWTHTQAAHFVRRVPASRVLREPLFSPTARPRAVESISTCSLRQK